MIEWKITNSQVCLETFKCDQAMSWEALKYHGVPHKDNPHMVFVEKEKQTSTAAAEGQVKSGLSSFPSCYSVAEERVEGVCCQGLWGVLPPQGACHLGWHRALWAHKIKVTFNTLCLQCSCHETLLFVSQDVCILHTPPPPRPNYTTSHKQISNMVKGWVLSSVLVQYAIFSHLPAIFVNIQLTELQFPFVQWGDFRPQQLRIIKMNPKSSANRLLVPDSKEALVM